ncbi:MAG: flagellar filament capping protein FliD, partial [Planctomycetes bacterium]|nr:flagellar filament capping protein FliD [Planctomycetota bacterium]
DTDTSAQFSIDITQVAAQASVASLGDLAASTVIGSGNKNLSFIINGNTEFISLTEGTYTRTEMADHLQQVMNDSIDSNGSKVEVNLSGDALELHSRYYGSSQSISILSSTTQSTLNLSTTEVTGQDVAGTIDGYAATGIGQVFQGVEGQGSEGLRLLITASAIVSGVTLDVFEGLGQRVSTSLNGMTDVETGTVTQKEDSLEEIIMDLGEHISDVDARLEERRIRLFSQFQQMEKLLQQFKSQENFLQGQIAGFQNMAASRANQ